MLVGRAHYLANIPDLFQDHILAPDEEAFPIGNLSLLIVSLHFQQIPAKRSMYFSPHFDFTRLVMVAAFVLDLFCQPILSTLAVS